MRSNPQYHGYQNILQKAVYPYKIFIFILYNNLVKEVIVMYEMILKTENLSKAFRGKEAVKSVSLEVPEACVYGILGPNGAGKSTHLNMMTGIMRPT